MTVLGILGLRPKLIRAAQNGSKVLKHSCKFGDDYLDIISVKLSRLMLSMTDNSTSKKIINRIGAKFRNKIARNILYPPKPVQPEDYMIDESARYPWEDPESIENLSHDVQSLDDLDSSETT